MVDVSPPSSAHWSRTFVELLVVGKADRGEILVECHIAAGQYLVGIGNIDVPTGLVGWETHEYISYTSLYNVLRSER